MFPYQSKKEMQLRQTSKKNWIVNHCQFPHRPQMEKAAGLIIFPLN